MSDIQSVASNNFSQHHSVQSQFTSRPSYVLDVNIQAFRERRGMYAKESEEPREIWITQPHEKTGKLPENF